MTRAVVVADADAGDGPTAFLPAGGVPLLRTLVDRLSAAGVADISVLTLGEWRDRARAALPETVTVLDAATSAALLESLAVLLAGSTERVVVLAGDLVVHEAALEELLAGAPDPSALATITSRGGDVRVRAGRVLSAASVAHRVTAPNAAAVGMLALAARDAPAAAAAVRAMAVSARDHGWAADVMGLLTVALVRRGVPLSAARLDGWPWARPTTAERAAEAVRAVAGTDAAAVRLRRSSRADDGFYSTFVVRRLSRPLTAAAVRRGLTPNQVTVFSLLLGLAAAATFALGSRAGLVAGALLLQASLVVDCVDGEVARLTRSFSALGGWLDAATDRVKEFAAYGGLAYGAVRAGAEPVWLLAGLALVLQTARHHADYNFTLLDRLQLQAPAVPLDQASDLGAPGEGRPAGGAGGAVAASERGNRVEAVRWAKHVLHLPIAERWLVISVGAATVGPRATLLVLLCLQVAALGYTTAGRILRSRTWRDEPVAARGPVDRELDGGPLAAALARTGIRPTAVAQAALIGAGAAVLLLAGLRLDDGAAARGALLVAAAVFVVATGLAFAGPVRGRFRWAVPSVLRLAELGLVLRLTQVLAPDAAGVAYLLLFVLAFHHYDTLYRVLAGAETPRWVGTAGFGYDGRMLLLGALALAGQLRSGLLVLACWLGLVFVVIATAQWLRTLTAPVREVARV